VALGSRLGAGGEAQIFEITGRGDLVAKIYHHPSAERTAKLQVMISAPPADPTAAQGHRSICWPTSLLFDRQRINVGFLMPRVDSAANLPIFKLCNPQDRQQVAPGFTWQYLLRTAANVASAVSAIHARSYVVGDLNESNILVSDSSLVSMVDCDSMQVPHPGTGMFFRCPVGKPEFTPPELQGCDFGRVDRLQKHDNFGLGVLIFQLLMEGTHPFSGVWLGTRDPPPIEERIRHGSSPYAGAKSATPMPGAPPFDNLPMGLRTLFQRCFIDGIQTPGARPTPREWQGALANAEASLSACSRNQLHIYCSHLANCPWCERARFLGGLDPFPASPQQRPLRQSRFVPPTTAPRRTPQPTINVPVPAAQPLPLLAPGPPPLTQSTGHRWGRMLLGGVLLLVLAIAGYRTMNTSNSPVVSPTSGQGIQPAPSPVLSQQKAQLFSAQAFVGIWNFVQNGAPNGTITFRPNGRYEMPHDGGPISGPYSVSSDMLVIEFPEIQFTAKILSAAQNTIKLRQTKSVDRTQGNAVSFPNDTWDLVRE
jgi:hypothetical protein